MTDEQMLTEWNRTERAYPLHTCLHQLLEEQADKTPDRPAVRFEGAQVSYSDLNMRANRCARFLRSLGVGPDVIVGILMDRSIEMVTALVGILKAGGAYLPLDPTYPEERLSFMLEDARVSVLLTQDKFKDVMPRFEGTRFCLDSEWDFLAGEPGSNLETITRPEHLAYIIYTSGSTGKPKGCMLPHRAICNRLLWMQEEYRLTGEDNVLQKTPFTFDVSVWEFFWPLLAGACLVMAKPEGHKDSNYLVETIRKENITTCHFVPSMLRFFATNANAGKCGSLRRVFTSGEALPYDLMIDFKRTLPAELHNLYGPTEAAVDVTYWECEERPDKKVPIGRPIANIQIYVLGPDLKMVPIGAEGELHIGGIGLARGYLNRQELTDEKFIKNPFSSEPDARLYKTGDRARFLPDGTIEYLGRIDFQVKLRGNRIELGEIEAVLREHDAIEEAVVMVRDEQSHDPKLVAYIVPKGDPPASKQVREFVKGKLPGYMVPNVVAPLNAIPVTQHGKLDRKALPWPITDVPEKKQVRKAAPHVKVRESVTSALLKFFQEALNRAALSAGDDLFDSGATSLTMVQMVETIQKTYQVEVPVEVFLDDPTIAAVAKYISERAEQMDGSGAAHDTDTRQTSGDSGRDAKPANETTIELRKADFKSEAYRGASIRKKFVRQTIDFHRFSGVLSLLRRETILGKPKYLYPSAGGLNAVQTYLYIKERAVEGLGTGIYYYHPEEHALYRIDDQTMIDSSLFCEYDRAAFDNAGFALFFIAQLDAIKPVYQAASPALVTLDSGYMGQLLMSRQADFKVRICPVAGVDFERISSSFKLGSGHRFIHCLLGGVPENSFSGSNGDAPEGETSGSVQAANITGHFRDYQAARSFAASLEADASMKFDKGDFLTKEEHDRFHENHLHIRRFSGNSTIITLEKYVFPESDYALRSCKRDYLKEKISFDRFSKFLTLLKEEVRDGNVLHLYPSLSGMYAVEAYLYIKDGGVEGIKQGIYRYAPGRHGLVPVTSELSKIVKTSYTPFNRTHYQKAAFCLFLVARLNRMRPVYRQESSYLALLEAGYIGQLLMDRQPEFDMGICPIGGVNFDRIRPDFKLDEDQVLLHSFTCGGFKYELPPHRRFLEAGRGGEIRKVEDERIPSRRAREPRRQDIAIVGIAGRYPGAKSLNEYWENLKKGKSFFQDLPESRRKLLNRDKAVRALRGAFLEDIDCFDSLLFNISPSEARMLDPQERVFLEIAWECLEDAGYTAERLLTLSPVVGVFAGAMWSDYQNQASAHSRDIREVPPMALHSSIANRVSYFFNFTGPSVAINTSCSSAMTALHFACESIKRGECDSALVGGVNLITHAYHNDVLNGLELLSKDGESRPLSAQASGWLAGEGAGAILIKPLDDAEQDKDVIHAVIKGTAIGHSGKTIRFGAPSSVTQSFSIQKALSDAGVAPRSISYIETAAAGAGIADASEIHAIKKAFQDEFGVLSPLLLGSVKANIGHLESASAMSQITKVVYQLKHHQLAPTIQCEPINPLLQLDGTGIEIVRRLKPWEAEASSGAGRAPLRALVNAFGATGSGGHIILEEYIGDKKAPKGPTPSLIPLSAAGKEQVYEQAFRLHEFISANEGRLDLSDIAYTLQTGRVAMDERLIIAADTIQELKALLGKFLNGDARIPEVYQGTVHRSEEINPSENGHDRKAAAERWVRGADINWDLFHDGSEKRVSLPGYPFRKERHWVKQHPETVANQEPLQREAAIVVSTSPGNGNHGADREKDFLAGIEDYLKTIFSSVSEIPLSLINARAALEKYGLSSLMVKALNARLEKDFGELSKTLFFEYRSIHDLAGYFAEHHGNRMQGLVVRPGEFPQTACHAGADAGPAAEKKKRFAPSPEEQPENRHMDIAIIGLSGRYPKARTIGAFWDNLRSGIDCITEIPKERWDHLKYYDPAKYSPGKTYCKWGGFIDDIDKFDPVFFGISPREAEIMDPQERLFLETVWHTFEDAGYSRRSLKEDFNLNVGVFVGVMYGEYHLLNENGNGGNPPVSVVSSFGSIANRISYVFDLHGPSMAIDTMCSSSLTALHLAAESIKRGECACAIAGGVNVAVHPYRYLLQSQLNMSSTDGRCRSFGEGGDGFVPGEGVGAVLLKPLQKAVQDGDHIYGVIRGTSVNHGGKTNGYMVPNPAAQSSLISDVLKKANIDPRAISYVEAHGTGTSLGDPIEIAGLSKSFGQYTNEKQFCPIGSVKSNIGHLESAAGIAALTKVLLQMKYKQLVPSLHSRQINTNINFEKTPFYVQQELAEWKQPAMEINGEARECPRLAAISSFGAGGSNAHALIEEFIPENEPFPVYRQSPAIILLSARNEDRLIEQVKQLLSALQGRQLSESGLDGIAYTLQVGREEMEERLAVLAGSPDELRKKLESFAEGRECVKDVYRGRVNPNNNDLGILAEDEEMHETLEKWIQRGKYSKLIGLWVKGLAIDWNRLYAKGTPHRVSLPVYPFARERYWVPQPRVRKPDNGQQTIAVQAPEPWKKANAKVHGERKPAPITLRPLADDQMPSAAKPANQERKQIILSPIGSTERQSTAEEHPQPAAAMHTTERQTTAAERAATEPCQAPGNAELLQEELAASLAEALYMKQTDISVDKNFVDMGLDSIIGVEWIRAVNKKYALSVPATKVYDYPTIRDFARYLETALKKRQAPSGEHEPVSARSCPSDRAPGSTRLSSEPTASTARLSQETAPAAQPEPGGAGLTRESLEEQLAASLADALYLKRIDIALDKNFVDMGLDSIIGVEWIRAVNKQFGTSIPATKVYDYPTIRDFSRLLQNELQRTGRAAMTAKPKTDAALTLDDLLKNVQQGSLAVERADQLLREIHFQGEIQ